MGFLNRLLGKPSNKSGNVAKERLQLVLIQDRVKLPPGVMDSIRDDIIDVISKYVDVDTDGIDITLTKTARQNRLVANIPILRTKPETR
ncbi:MAG: cell division topological specificity factor MinE [Anaerolineae bacterium]